jgi:pimeloyl-ACP methyl ester carboxylesterase
MSDLTRTEPLTRQGFQLYSAGSVNSRYGTPMAYRYLGSGSCVVLVQGTMGSAHNYMEIADILAVAFTVHVPDRRGRPGEVAHTVTTIVYRKKWDDLDALLTATGAQLVLGLSSGAIFALQALPTITKVAIFELLKSHRIPPLFLNWV